MISTFLLMKYLHDYLQVYERFTCSKLKVTFFFFLIFLETPNVEDLVYNPRLTLRRAS